MRKASLTVVAVCATLLWVGTVNAKPKPPSQPEALPATGQTTSYVAGDDGAIKAGAPLSYTDNGDGTITDNNTKLVWEKKSNGDSSLHDRNLCYPWSGLCSGDGLTSCGTTADCSLAGGTCGAADCQNPISPNGMTIFQWVAELNSLNSGAGFAGHKDWRVPNVKELQSIVDYQNAIPNSNPAVAAAFDTGCTSTCTVTMCSCTQPSGYWSSTTNANIYKWFVSFDLGYVFFDDNFNDGRFVRAVRGGL